MSLRQRISAAARAQHNRYPDWVIEECRRLYREGRTVAEVANLSGVSTTTIENWRCPFNVKWRKAADWDDPIPALQQVKRSRLVMPTDAAGCLIVAAELLWIARGGK